MNHVPGNVWNYINALETSYREAARDREKMLKMLNSVLVSNQKLQSEIREVRVVMDKLVTQQLGQEEIVVEICDDGDIPCEFEIQPEELRMFVR